MRRLISPNEIQTNSGKMIDVKHMTPDDVDLNDIAHALSMICRYNGHCSKFYSVAEHSVYVSQICQEEDAKWGLMHDAVECYVGDMIRPLKNMDEATAFMDIEDNLQLVIAEKFGLDKVIPESVHWADDVVLLAEKDQLIPVNHDWGFREDHTKWPKKIHAWSPQEAKFNFLNRYRELFDNQ